MRYGRHNIVLMDFDWLQVITKATAISVISIIVEVVVSGVAHWGLWPGILIAAFSGLIELFEELIHELSHALVFLIAGHGAEIEIGFRGGTTPRDANLRAHVHWTATIADPLASLVALAFFIVLMINFEQATLGSLMIAALVCLTGILNSVFSAEGDIALTANARH
jgi:hypothetical protein